MVICPHCAYPFTGDANIIAERDVTCSRCTWSGPSSKLLVVDEDKILDPRVFDQLYFFLHKEIAPLVGRTMIQLKLVSQGSSPEEVQHFATMLRDYTSAGFEVLVRKVLDPDGRAKDTAPDSTT